MRVRGEEDNRTVLTLCYILVLISTHYYSVCTFTLSQ